MATFESGEVLLTTTIGEVGGEIVSRVMTWNLAAGELFPQFEAVQPSKRRRLGVRQCPAGVERTGQLDQHLTRNFRLRDMEDAGEQPFRQIDGHAHFSSLAAFPVSAI